MTSWNHHDIEVSVHLAFVSKFEATWKGVHPWDKSTITVVVRFFELGSEWDTELPANWTTWRALEFQKSLPDNFSKVVEISFSKVS